MIIGSGPVIIGQATEFDYADTQACEAMWRSLNRSSMPRRQRQRRRQKQEKSRPTSAENIIMNKMGKLDFCVLIGYPWVKGLDTIQGCLAQEVSQ